MIKLILIVVITFISVSAYSQATLYGKISNGRIIPCATIYGTKSLSESGKVGFTYFGLIQESWAEAQFGLYYNPTTWSQIGISCGLEQNTNIFRTGAFIWLGKGNASFIALLEKGSGKDNYWYKVTLSQKIGNFDLGLRGWRYTGFGPVIQYKIGNTGMKAWVMPALGLFESSQNSIVLGIDFKI